MDCSVPELSVDLPEASSDHEGSTVRVYIGSYSISSPWAGAEGAVGQGITCAEIDVETGDSVVLGTTSLVNPSYLLADPRRGRLYALTECEGPGEVVAYDVEPSSGELSESWRVASGADAPCHLALDASGDSLLVSHYNGHRLSRLPLGADGRPGTVTTVEPPARPGAAAPARPHSATALPDTGDVLVPDTGRDQLLRYRLGDPSSGEHPLAEVARLTLPADHGPRTLALLADKQVVYVSNQTAGSISVVGYGQADDPGLELLQTVDSPGLGRSRSVPSEVAVHPSGEVVYLANRRDDSLSVFVIGADGALELAGAVDTVGRTPRHFGITPDGRLLLVANQHSGVVTSFEIASRGRELRPLAPRLELGAPSCVLFHDPRT